MEYLFWRSKNSSVSSDLKPPLHSVHTPSSWVRFSRASKPDFSIAVESKMQTSPLLVTLMRLPVDGLDWVFMTEFMPTSKNVGGNYSAHRKNFNIPNTDDKSERGKVSRYVAICVHWVLWTQKFPPLVHKLMNKYHLMICNFIAICILAFVF